MFSLSSWMKIRLKVSGVSSSSCKTSVRSSTLFRVTAPPAHGTATYFSRTPIGRARDGVTNDLSNAAIGPARTPQRELELGGVDILDVLVRQRQDDRRDVLLKHGCVSRSDQTSSLRPPSFDWRWTGCARHGHRQALISDPLSPAWFMVVAIAVRGDCVPVIQCAVRGVASTVPL